MAVQVRRGMSAMQYIAGRGSGPGAGVSGRERGPGLRDVAALRDSITQRRKGAKEPEPNFARTDS